MRLVKDARRVASKAWSVRLSALAAVAGTLELVLPIVIPALPSGWALKVSILLAVSSLVARLIDQPKMRGEDS